jgi:predicted enzyme related to lactoylglutathione lyase
MNIISYFEIQATEPAKLAEFYKNVFGWEFVKDESIPIDYYRLAPHSGQMGAILQRPAPVPALSSGTNAYVCSIQVEHFDSIGEKILQNGGQIALPKFPVPGKCWQGYFLDSDQNTFGVFQVDEQAR